MANTAFDKLVGTRPDGHKIPLSKSRKKPEEEPLPKVKALATQVAYGRQAQEDRSVSKPMLNTATQGYSTKETPTICLFCDGTHSLERCLKFRDKSFDERLCDDQEVMY